MTNINRKFLIWSQNKILSKFGKKKERVCLVLGKVYENCPNLRKSIILRNLLRREYYHPETPDFVPRYGNNEIQTKKMGEFGFRQSVEKLPEI